MTLQQLGHPADTTSVHDTDSTFARVRFAVLWLVAGCALAGTMAVFFYEPGVLEEGVAGEMEGDPVTMGMALLNAAMLALPLAVAAVTLFLTTRASAITNLVAGVPLGTFGLYAVANHVAQGAWHAHLTLAALATVIAWLIVALSIAQLRRPSHHEAAPAVVRVDSGARGA
jgi:Na+/melibiose symporter-like transporter